MTDNRKINIAFWVLWNVAFLASVWFAVWINVTQPSLEAVVPRIIDSLLAPVSLLFIGFAVWFRFETLSRLAAAIAVISGVYSIALVTATIGYENYPFPHSNDYWTEILALVVQVIYIALHIRNDGKPDAPYNGKDLM